MPASGADPVATALRFGFATGSKINDHLDNGLEVSSKRILQTIIKMEETASEKSAISSTGTQYRTLKAKYVVINTKIASEKSNVVNSPVKKSLTLPVPKNILFPTEKVQLGFRSSLPVGSGMHNLGNTCYLNSTLQALFHVPAFVNYLLADPDHQRCEQYSEVSVHNEDITCALIKTLKCSQTKTGSVMKPTCIYYKLKAICKHLSQGSQEDAHEFMRYLLESLEKGYLTKKQGHNLDSWSKETTPINQIFGGYIRTEVSCLNCHAVSTTFQHFQDLPLDIRKASQISEALNGYFAREHLPGGEDAYKCEKCCRKVDATKKFSIERPPNVLCIQLKRFSAMNGKLTKHVGIPRNLDLSPFLSTSAQQRHTVLYRLVAMVTHIGHSANCGHYTAVACAANNTYYQFDDSCVKSVPINSVQNMGMGAYLVMYELERPYQPIIPRPPSTESIAQKQSESASTGGSEAKEPRRSPTAGTLAPETSSTPSLTSLVPYDSDADSDAEKEKEPTSNGWKPPPPPVSTTSWRVTDLKPRSLSLSSNGRSPNNSGPSSRNNGTPTKDSSMASTPEKLNAPSMENKRNTVVSELLQNSHQGYGNNQIRTWNGGSNNIGRQIDDERRDSRKRSYNSEYNHEFDRGKAKKRYFNGQRDNNRPGYGNDGNPFQRRANMFNGCQKRPNHDFKRNNWKDRRNHSKPYYRPYGGQYY